MSDNMTGKRMVCVVSPRIGAFSEVWLLRQLKLFVELKPMALTWELLDLGGYALGDVEVRRFDGARVEKGAARWILRFTNARSGNYLALPAPKVRSLVEMLGQKEVSAILCHFGYTGLQMLPVARTLGVPMIAHFHGVDLSSVLSHRWYRRSLVRMAPNFDAVVCVGWEQRERLMEIGFPGERIHVIPCGVPVEAFPYVERIHGGGGRFVCVSRLVESKGIHHSVAAYARIASQLPGSRLVVIGDGPQKAFLQELAEKKGVSASVEFKGALPESQVREVLLTSDIFLQHSLSREGFGVSIAEASSTGMPVVVSACGGILDQVVDGVTGIVVAQRDETAMAEAMLKLALDQNLRKQMGLAGRERIAKHFDTPRQVAKLEKVIMDVLPTAEGSLAGSIPQPGEPKLTVP